jgi:hypothetical protein
MEKQTYKGEGRWAKREKFTVVISAGRWWKWLKAERGNWSVAVNR